MSSFNVFVIFPAGLLSAYLAGSVNFSILLFRLLGMEDPRRQFSGNPGVTNVFRQAGWFMAALILFLDVGRAAAVALLAHRYWPVGWVPWAGLALILGNHLPCFHGFRGGKGVANFLGFYAVLMPMAVGFSVFAYIVLLAVTRVPFIGSFGLMAVLTAFGLHRWWAMWGGVTALVITAGAIVWYHRSNIAVLREKLS